MPAVAPGYLGEAEILAECQLPWPGLYRTHETQNIAAVAACIAGAFRGGGEISLGARRSLAVIAVDGLGYRVAAAELAPDVLVPVTTTFPSTTTTAFLTSLTGCSPSQHGVVGVQYLHPDGRRGYNCITGGVTEPDGPWPVRATASPALRTAFTELSDLGVPAFCLPGELAQLSPDWQAAAFGGSRVLDGRRGLGGLPAVQPAPGDDRGPLPGDGGVHTIVDAVTSDLEAAVGEHQDGLVWAYLNLDDHLHRNGPDQAIARACRVVDALARRLSRAGVAVLLYADHGCAASRPGAGTMAGWDEVSSPLTCRLPAGGAGRVRWLYPRAGEAARLASRLPALLPEAVVSTPAELARCGVVEAGSVGQARLGEIVLLASGPDFPVPEPALAYEHGSLTAEEMLVPLAIWQPS